MTSFQLLDVAIWNSESIAWPTLSKFSSRSMHGSAGAGGGEAGGAVCERNASVCSSGEPEQMALGGEWLAATGARARASEAVAHSMDLYTINHCKKLINSGGEDRSWPPPPHLGPVLSVLKSSIPMTTYPYTRSRPIAVITATCRATGQNKHKQRGAEAADVDSRETNQHTAVGVS